jgi:autotransporter family porin
MPAARTLRRARLPRGRKTQRETGLARLRCFDRKSLLLGTALASTLVIGNLLSPTPANAVVNCPAAAFPPPGPIAIVNPADDIGCTNVFDRHYNAGSVIGLATDGANEYIALDNSGDLVNTSGAGALGIFAFTADDDSPIDVVNSGDVTAYSGIIAFGIRARSVGANSPIDIVNSGDVTVTGNTFNAFGIHAYTYDADSPIAIWNSGEIFVISNGMNSVATGVYARTGYLNTDYDNGSISILNSGDVTVITTGVDTQAYGIYARTDNDDSAISIVNSGDGVVTLSEIGPI